MPIYRLATDALKDTVADTLDRPEPGPNYLHIPDWLPRWWYDELTYEVRDDKGHWSKPGGRPNEAWDLCVYNLSAWLHLGGERLNWDAPKPWAREWDKNPLVLSADAAKAVRESNATERRVPNRRRRRTSRSSYLNR